MLLVAHASQNEAEALHLKVACRPSQGQCLESSIRYPRILRQKSRDMQKMSLLFSFRKLRKMALGYGKNLLRKFRA